MISSIKGKVIYKTDKFIVVDVSGIGYKIFVTTDSIVSNKEGMEVSFWTYMAVRENSIDLYGFSSIEEMSFFELLLNVSGVGPKSALSIINIAPTQILKGAIATGDTSYLNKVSGIGKKTAERIVIDLRDKLKNYENSETNTSIKEDNDVMLALKSLGYSQNESREALKKISSSTEGTNNRVREALRILSNRD
jgi:Holliday junction DNA helicase RuvA